MKKPTTKQRATLLLREYDLLRKRLRETERELAKAVTTYGREQGYWGLTKDAFRIQIEQEEAVRIEMQAAQDAWEKAHA